MDEAAQLRAHAVHLSAERASARPRVAGSSSSIAFVDRVSDLAVIFEPNVNVVALRRHPLPDLAVEAARAVREVTADRRFVLSAEAPWDPRCGELTEFPRLAEDVCFWAEVLAELTGSGLVGARLARLDRAMCPRFHVDHVTLRLVTTYLGRGTEFASNDQVDRRRLGRGVAGEGDASHGALLSPKSLRASAPFDVVLLKGEAWPENAGAGAVHRSPAASATEPRLVLTLDPL